MFVVLLLLFAVNLSNLFPGVWAAFRWQHAGERKAIAVYVFIGVEENLSHKFLFVDLTADVFTIFSSFFLMTALSAFPLCSPLPHRSGINCLPSISSTLNHMFSCFYAWHSQCFSLLFFCFWMANTADNCNRSNNVFFVDKHNIDRRLNCFRRAELKPTIIIFFPALVLRPMRRDKNGLASRNNNDKTKFSSLQVGDT